jgi:hypothetical protein
MAMWPNGNWKIYVYDRFGTDTGRVELVDFLSIFYPTYRHLCPCNLTIFLIIIHSFYFIRRCGNVITLNGGPTATAVLLSGCFLYPVNNFSDCSPAQLPDQL